MDGREKSQWNDTIFTHIRHHIALDIFHLVSVVMINVVNIGVQFSCYLVPFLACFGYPRYL